MDGGLIRCLGKGNLEPAPPKRESGTLESPFRRLADSPILSSHWTTGQRLSTGCGLPNSLEFSNLMRLLLSSGPLDIVRGVLRTFG
jgi:hypothetical protein